MDDAELQEGYRDGTSCGTSTQCCSSDCYHLAGIAGSGSLGSLTDTLLLAIGQSSPQLLSEHTSTQTTLLPTTCDNKHQHVVMYLISAIHRR